jgi:hypothetical protein
MRFRICMGRLAASLALSVLGGLGWTAGASAGRYHVYSCRMPDGEIAPVDGWSGSKTGTYSYAEDTCARPLGGLLAALGDEPVREANTDVATWAFGAPPWASIRAAAFWRAGDTAGGAAINATYEYWLAGPTISQPFDECSSVFGCPGMGDRTNAFAPNNRIAVPPTSLGRALFATVSCGGVAEYKCPAGKGDANGYAAALYVYAADITLEQAAGPHASSVSGELTSAQTLHGSSDVAFDATDPGAGVWQAQFAVDGAVVQRTVLADNGGRCRDVGQTVDGLPAFLYVEPCLQSLSADVQFDSTKASNGVHRLTVSVLDAAGNAAPVLDRMVTIANPPPPGAPNGRNASAQARLAVRWLGTAKATARGGFGRGRRLLGRLTTATGQPIAGAAIDVRAAPAYAGAKSLTLASPVTDGAGRFEIDVRAGTSSRTLRFGYRAHLDDVQPAATAALRLITPAGIALRVSPHTASAGSSIYFRGRLRGGPIPRGGKQLVLEARSPGSAWIEFKVIRTDRRGRFRAAYRFKFPGPADYRFRVRSEAESDFPFAAGSSNVVGVHER